MDVEWWPRGLRMIVRGRKTDRRLTKRGVVDDFSDSSRRRLAWAYSQGPWLGMLTLTYPGSQILDREKTKKHLDSFLKQLQRRNIPYLWIMEFQRRGQVHYHVWVGRNLSDTTDPVLEQRQRRFFPWRRLMMAWLRIIGEDKNRQAQAVALHPMSYQQWEVRVGNNYAAKYADKRRQKGLPVGVGSMGRWWGRSRGLTEPSYSVHVPESTESVQIRRQIQKYIKRRFLSVRNKFLNPTQGVRRAFDGRGMVDVYRILSYYLGPDPFEWRKKTLLDKPDTESYVFRCAMSLHRRRWGASDAA